YMLRGGQLEQISVDHSVVQEMIDSGEMTSDEAKAHPMRNVITRSIGGGYLTKPDTWLVPVERNQRLLVCSDGLTGEVDNATIARVLRAHPSPANAAAELLQLTLQAGARDNVSIAVVDVDAVDSDDGWEDTNRLLVSDTVPRGA
ncbi:PP2C family protein-serine/threonine phosphatase, partial [Agrococcus casei]